MKNSVSGEIITDHYLYKSSKKTWLIISIMAFVFVFLFMLFPKSIRMPIIFFPLAIVSLFYITKPRIWVLFLPILVTFGNRVVDFGPFYSAVVTFAVIGVAFYYFAIKLAGFRSFPTFPFPFYVIFLAYLLQVASMFSSFYNHNNLPWNTLREASKIYMAALLLPVIYDWFGRGEWFTRFLQVITVMLFLMSIYGLYQYNSGNLNAIGEKASGFDLAGRVYSTILGGPNSYSGVLELLVPTMLAAAFYFKGKFWKIFTVITVILGFQNVLYTFSRGGFITVSLSCIVFLVYRYRKKVWIPIIVASVLVGGILTNAAEFERQLTVFQNPTALVMDTSLLHRYISYKGFISEIKKDPITGIGWGAYEYFHSRVSLYSFWEVRHEDSIDKIERFGGLNSLILEMPLKGGVLSALSLLVLFSALVITSVKAFKQASDKSLAFGMTCGLFAFGSHQAFDNLLPWPQTGAFFWMIFALLISLTYKSCDKELDSL